MDTKRVAVAGATGQVGQAVVAALRDAGQVAVELSRGQGVDVLTGNGLDDALAGADVVIDVLNTSAIGPDETVGFFTRTSDNLLAAGQRHGVRHHVLLSIVNVDAVPDNAHYAGKVAQEQRVENGPVPWTILRATQFHSFAEMVAGWTTADGVAAVAPLLVQPVDVGDVAAVLTELALGSPAGRPPDLAGPDTLDLVDMAVRTFAARGSGTTVRASWRDSPFRCRWPVRCCCRGPAPGSAAHRSRPGWPGTPATRVRWPPAISRPGWPMTSTGCGRCWPMTPRSAGRSAPPIPGTSAWPGCRA
jgi:uncharacterized protein YbjT (DUF2867 family)